MLRSFLYLNDFVIFPDFLRKYFIFACLFELVFANISIENKQHIVVIDWDCLRVLEPWLKSTLSFYYVQGRAKHALMARNTPRRKWNLNLKNIPRAIPIFFVRQIWWDHILTNFKIFPWQDFSKKAIFRKKWLDF